MHTILGWWQETKYLTIVTLILNFSGMGLWWLTSWCIVCMFAYISCSKLILHCSYTCTLTMSCIYMPLAFWISLYHWTCYPSCITQCMVSCFMITIIVKNYIGEGSFQAIDGDVYSDCQWYGVLSSGKVHTQRSGCKELHVSIAKHCSLFSIIIFRGATYTVLIDSLPSLGLIHTSSSKLPTLVYQRMCLWKITSDKGVQMRQLNCLWSGWLQRVSVMVTSQRKAMW